MTDKGSARPDVRAIFARASGIAEERYPAGCSSATILAKIVREAVAELYPQQSPPKPGRTNRLDTFHEAMRSEIVRICAETTRINCSADTSPCTDRNHACYRCQDMAAQRISPNPTPEHSHE